MRDLISICLKKPASSFTIYLRRYPWLWSVPALLICLLAIMATRPAPSSLQHIFDRGELVVVTRADPVAFYTDQHGDTGFDYELARRFAASLGVKLRVIQADNIDQAYRLLERGRADLVAGAFTLNHQRASQVTFSHGYLATGSHFIYRAGDTRPDALDELKGHRVAVLAGSNDAVYLKQLSSQGLSLQLDEVDGVDNSKVMARVSQGQDDYALINDQAFTLQHPLFPDLAIAFPAEDPQQFAWAIQKPADPGLLAAVNHFLDTADQDGTIKTLAAQFYGKHNSFNLYAAQTFMRHLDERLPKYSGDFYEAAQDNQLDWRLLAAMGYQESHWNPGAQSPTGVRGLMMLTQNTATKMGVDRDDPSQSIEGGARYLRQLLDGLPAHIQQPDRTWMAIAAYNIGAAHLEDARVLTQRQGGNPDNWNDVKKRLPLLNNAAYDKELRYGPADGTQAVRYVTNIHHYYNLLVWAENSLGDRNNLLALAN